MEKEVSRFTDSTIFEGMTSIRSVLQAAKDGISDRRIIKILFAAEKEAAKKKELDFLKIMAAKLNFSLERTSMEAINGITTGNSHGGIIAFCTERSILPISADNIADGGFYVMIEGIEDPYNFGYAIRTIYASGADGIILSPRNWMSAAGVVCRSSAGASELIPIYISTAENAAVLFRSKGYKIIGAGIRNSVSAFEADLRRPLFLIVGGEKRGISSSVLNLCDCVVRLDYGREFRNSLSAASAASILSYEILRQNIK